MVAMHGVSKGFHSIEALGHMYGVSVSSPSHRLIQIYCMEDHNAVTLSSNNLADKNCNAIYAPVDHALKCVDGLVEM